jgi:antitoxin component of MazEF toxin-antitoxin module
MIKNHISLINKPLRKQGNSYYIRIPKEIIKNGLLDMEKKYNIEITDSN